MRPQGALVGKIVSVEPLEERHREGLRAAAEAGLEIFRFMAWPGDFDRYFDEALGSGDIAFAVCRAARRYMAYLPEHRRVEIGWTWLRRSAWGTGANIEAKLLLLEHAFDRCGMQRVEFKTDARNHQTRGSLLALGARFEGIARKHMVLPDSIRDSAWYAVVDDDWPRVKAMLEGKIARHAGG